MKPNTVSQENVKPPYATLPLILLIILDQFTQSSYVLNIIVKFYLNLWSNSDRNMLHFVEESEKGPQNHE